jgi:hypothetical protein
LEQKTDRSHLDESLKHYRKTRRTLDSHVRGIEGHRPIHPAYLTVVISELADDDAVFAADNGMCTVWAARYLGMSKDRRLLGSCTGRWPTRRRRPSGPSSSTRTGRSSPSPGTAVSPSELAMPPKTSIKQAKGFSLYVLKETLSGHGDDMVEMIESNLLR